MSLRTCWLYLSSTPILRFTSHICHPFLHLLFFFVLRSRLLFFFHLFRRRASIRKLRIKPCAHNHDFDESHPINVLTDLKNVLVSQTRTVRSAYNFSFSIVWFSFKFGGWNVSVFFFLLANSIILSQWSSWLLCGQLVIRLDLGISVQDPWIYNVLKCRMQVMWCTGYSQN